MEKFTYEIFKTMINGIDYENTYDLETFSQALEDRFDFLYASDIDNIIDFITNEMENESDSDVYNMTDDEIDQLVVYINQLFNEIYDEE